MDWFYNNYLLREYDDDTVNKIKASYNNKRISSFRVNTLKTSNKEVEDILRSNNVDFNKASFYDSAYTTNNLNKIKELNIYEEGKIYFQSLSSMIPPLFLDLKENESLLDMAAAPGGKTSLIAALSNNKILITALEKNKIRYDRLKYNLDKLAVKKVTVLNEDARELDSLFRFDEILLDAPCSGSGTLNINDTKYFNEDLIKRSIKVQELLIKKAIEVLKIGGNLIYSTCSILKEENEEILNNVLKQGNVKIVPISMNNLPLLKTTIDGVICVRPNDMYEGFFIAKLKKIK